MRRRNCMPRSGRFQSPGQSSPGRLRSTPGCELPAEDHMSRFQITVIRPPGYLHSEAFREIAETLQYGLRSLGHSAQIRENGFDSAAMNIVLGAHLLLPDQAGTLPPGSVLYNLEQLGGPSLPPSYYELACRHQIWDYSLRNIEKWKALNCAHTPVHVAVGYAEELRRIKNSQPADIDVLFYGSLNERRARILKILRDSGLKVHAVFGVYGKERDELIARSKIVLNMHFYEAKLFEIVRVSYLLANSKAVVAECSSGSEMEEDLKDAVVAVPYSSLVEKCIALLKDEKSRHELERRGFQRFSERRESDILKAALEQSGKPLSRAVPPLTRKLNLGCGADRHPDYINVDFDPSCQPDVIADLN